MQSTFSSELIKVHLRFTGRSSLNPARDHGTIAATAVAMSHEAAPRRASMTSTAKRAICPAAAGGLAERVGDTLTTGGSRVAKECSKSSTVPQLARRSRSEGV